MMGVRFMFKKEKQEIVEKLKYYGITELPYLLVYSGKEKIRGYSGSLSMDEIRNLNENIGLEIIGQYLLHDYPDGMRISFDAIFNLGNQITKNVIDLNEKQQQEFLKGNDILLTKNEEEILKKNGETKGFKIIRITTKSGKKELIGTGKLLDGRILNYMPKERRMR
jgi:NOL1/NOP2/fmu family ribosome biogenesis protein